MTRIEGLDLSEVKDSRDSGSAAEDTVFPNGVEESDTDTVEAGASQHDIHAQAGAPPTLDTETSERATLLGEDTIHTSRTALTVPEHGSEAAAAGAHNGRMAVGEDRNNVQASAASDSSPLPRGGSPAPESTGDARVAQDDRPDAYGAIAPVNLAKDREVPPEEVTAAAKDVGGVVLGSPIEADDADADGTPGSVAGDDQQFMQNGLFSEADVSEEGGAASEHAQTTDSSDGMPDRVAAENDGQPALGVDNNLVEADAAADKPSTMPDSFHALDNLSTSLTTLMNHVNENAESGTSLLDNEDADQRKVIGEIREASAVGSWHVLTAAVALGVEAEKLNNGKYSEVLGFQFGMLDTLDADAADDPDNPRLYTNNAIAELVRDPESDLEYDPEGAPVELDSFKFTRELLPGGDKGDSNVGVSTVEGNITLIDLTHAENFSKDIARLPLPTNWPFGDKTIGFEVSVTHPHPLADLSAIEEYADPLNPLSCLPTKISTTLQFHSDGRFIHWTGVQHMYVDDNGAGSNAHDTWVIDNEILDQLYPSVVSLYPESHTGELTLDAASMYAAVSGVQFVLEDPKYAPEWEETADSDTAANRRTVNPIFGGVSSSAKRTAQSAASRVKSATDGARHLFRGMVAAQRPDSQNQRKQD